ncbi:MAG TPA: hypothetical protein VEI57_15465 [Nitrospirota bacterium]|nr:hypothetical protein [Nitrospirota bacterium]
MDCDQVVQQIDNILRSVLNRVGVLQRASTLYARYMGTKRPGLERMLCAEIYLAFHESTGPQIVYVEFPARASSRAKIDIAADYGEKFVYIEAKMYDRAARTDYQKDFDKLYRRADSEKDVLCIWLHFGLYPESISSAAAFFTEKCQELGCAFEHSLTEIDGTTGIRFVRLAFWKKNNQTK